VALHDLGKRDPLSGPLGLIGVMGVALLFHLLEERIDVLDVNCGGVGVPLSDLRRL